MVAFVWEFKICYYKIKLAIIGDTVIDQNNIKQKQDGFMQEHKEWLRFAEGDLKTAKILLNADYVVISAVCFHAQQCVEKVLKAYLVFKKKKAKKTCDLAILLNACVDCDQEFLSLQNDANALMPYTSKISYPDSGFAMPSLSLAEDAYKRAKKIFDFVLNKI